MCLKNKQKWSHSLKTKVKPNWLHTDKNRLRSGQNSSLSQWTHHSQEVQRHQSTQMYSFWQQTLCWTWSGLDNGLSAAATGNSSGGMKVTGKRRQGFRRQPERSGGGTALCGGYKGETGWHACYFSIFVVFDSEGRGQKRKDGNWKASFMVTTEEPTVRRPDTEAASWRSTAAGLQASPRTRAHKGPLWSCCCVVHTTILYGCCDIKKKKRKFVWRETNVFLSCKCQTNVNK